jgi:hypothetical protein
MSDMPKNIQIPDADRYDPARLAALPPLQALRDIMGWWPSYDALGESVGRFLPEHQRPERRGLYAWSRRGIPRARQVALMRAAEEDFGAVLTYELIERLTADRIAEEQRSPTAPAPMKPSSARRAAQPKGAIPHGETQDGA